MNFRRTWGSGGNGWRSYNRARGQDLDKSNSL